MAGQLFSIVDEDAKICKGSHTGIWIKDRFYRADEKGRVLIPFSTEVQEQAILIHNDFAELTTIDLKQEGLEFKCSYIYHRESFIMGNQAKVLVQPKLFLNEQPVGLDLVQECGAEIVMNTEDDVPSIVTFENIKLSNHEEKQLDFTIPAKLASIDITLKAKILPVNQEEPKEYTSTHQITVSTPQRDFLFCDLYLKYTPDGHQVYLLGKNGEPKANVPISFLFRNKFSPNQIHQKLQTDKEGKVSLGKLEEITRVEATISQHGDIVSFQRQWNVNNLKTINYPSHIRICEGDQVVLPLLHNELNRHKFSFCEELEDGTILHNLLSYLKIDKRKLVISDLKEGFYKLFLKDIDQVISITVFKGTYWSENEDYLYTKNLLINVKADVNNIIITDLKINQLPDAELADITLQTYADQPKLTRFHIFGAQFMESDPEKFIQDMDSTIPEERRERDQVFLGLKHNQFLNNRKLGDEYCYVLDRKTQARYLGNTLEKPKILLKQTFVRDTQTKQEQLQQNQEFQNVALTEQRAPRMQLATKAARKSVGGAYYDRPYDGERRGARRVLQSTKSFNFLANPCLIESNVGPDKNGQVILRDFPVKKYPLLQIIGTNSTANISQVFPLNPENIQTKDLRQQARDENAVFSISRRGVQVFQGEKVAINDLASSSFLVIDTLKKLFEVQRNLASCNHTYQYNDTTYDAWSFLKNWQDLTPEEKIRKYDKFAGHELNLFVYSRDKKFFEDVVLPFLHNKTEKTLVDFFLLSDQETLKNSARPESFNKLNALEKVLIILFVQTFDKQQAKNLADSLQNLNDLNKTDPNIFKKYFDTVLAFQKDQDKPFDGAAPEMLQPPRIQNSAFAPVMLNVLQQAGFGAMNMMPQMQQQQMQLENYKGGARTKQTARLSTGGARGGRGGSYGVMKKKRMVSRDKGLENDDEEEADFNSISRSSRSGSSDSDEDYSPRNGDDDEFLEKRKKIKAGYQELGKTKEYTERHYYGRPQTQVSIQLNQFWIDLARHIVDNGLSKSFLTHNFITAHSSHSEMIAVLSFISLPFTAGEHKYTPRDSRGLEIEAASDLILLTKTIEEAESDLKNDVIVIQRFYDPQDRYTKSTEEPGLQIEKEIDQYIIDKVYGCTVIATNLSTSVQQAQVLVEVPEGSIPVQTQDYTKFHDLTIAAYATQTIEFFFYFPQVGKFRSNPPNVSKKGKVLAVAKSFDFQIQKEKIYHNLDTLDAVLSTGSQDDILEFARTKNIWDHKVFNFHSVYWLLLKKPFFLKFIHVLRERKYFDLTTWQFGFHHKDIQTIQEYLAFDAGASFPNCIQYLESSLLKIDKFKVLEYNPLVNQRVHLLHSEKNRILNAQLEEQYKKIITYLCERPSFEVKHYLGLVYYLFLQDRVDEAIRFFSQINKEDIEMNRQYRLQYDYFAAYIDFVIGYPKFSIAKEICQKYLSYPVLSWRKLFIEISEQLEEAEEKEPDHMEIEASGEAKKEAVYGNKQNQLNAVKEEVVTLEVQKTQLEITHQNLAQFTLAFYRVDLEVLFSKNPFITKEKDEFSFIQPAESRQIKIDNPHDLQKTAIEIPESLRKYNLYIDLKTENKTLSETYFSNSLQVHLIEAYGQVKVLDLNNKPLPKVLFLY